MLSLESAIHRLPTVVPYGLTWLFLVLLFAGIGATTRKATFGRSDRDNLAWLDFWVGFSVATILLQLWHLCLPIDSRATVLLVVCALPGLAFRLSELDLSNLRRATFLAPVATLAIALPWLALRFQGPVTNGDTGLYHLQSVVWISSFPIVPGLGNLHDRLAFNSSFHLYAALCDALPSPVPSYRLANGPIFLVSLAQLIRAATQTVHSKWMRIRRLFCLLMVGPLLLQALTPQFNGLAPDFAIVAMELALAGLLFQVLQRKQDTDSSRYQFVAATLLGAVMITIKLSAAVVATITGVICLVRTLRIEAGAPQISRLKALVAGAVTGALALGPWAIRGAILSGYPFYPAPVLALPVEWRVPMPLVLSINYWIQSWARIPFAHWVDVLGNWEWVSPWLDRHTTLIRAPGIVTAIGMVLGSVAWLRSRHRGVRPLLFLAPPIFGLTAWFITAPDIRFARGPLWITAAAVLAMGISSLPEGRSSRFTGLIDFTAGLALLLCIVPMADLHPRRPPPQPLLRSEIRHYTTRSGDQINYPTPGNQCWDAPPPCTPYLRPSLRLRQHGRPGSGFVLDDPFECLDLHACIPGDVRRPQELGISLHRGDWHPRSRIDGRRWMNARGRIILYAAEPRRAVLRLHPIEVAEHVKSNTVEVLLNGTLKPPRKIELGRNLELGLDLRAGLNIVTLEMPGPPAHPNRKYPWKPGEGRVSVGFSSIEIY